MTACQFDHFDRCTIHGLGVIAPTGSCVLGLSEDLDDDTEAEALLAGVIVRNRPAAAAVLAADWPDDIDADTAVHYVLRAAGEPGNWLEAGGFFSRLVEAALHADPDNLKRIEAGFPTLVSTIRMWRELGGKTVAAMARQAEAARGGASA